MTIKISTRLWIPTLVIAGVLTVMAGVVATRTSSHIASTDALLRGQDSKLHDAAVWQGMTSTNAVRVVASVLSSDPAVEAAMKPEIAATTAKISEIQQRIDAAATDSDERTALARVADARKLYVATRNAAMKVKSDGDGDAAKAMLARKMQPALTDYQASQQAYVALQQGKSDAVRAQAGADRMTTVWGVVALMGLLVLGMSICTVLTVRAICRPMNTLVDIARRIGEGDLDAEVPTEREDEIGAVTQSLATMRDSLRGIVSEVRQASESIQVASAEVASGNLDLSLRTEQAASSLQQTASSMAQLTGNVRQSADAAAQANQLAASAAAVAQRGGAVVSQVVATMDEINHSSKRIADIIGTIDGIAFQTNILALNAAVEAARAGEQGRGFAVVASEVRSLAQRSAEAAREIKTLIGASVERVETGARLVQDAGSTMGEIVASVQRVTDVIGEITAAAAEQSQGIGSVNNTVSRLDQMTQQNAALVEQSAAAAESLRDQAQRLSQSMQVFRLSGTAAGTGRSVAPARPATAAATPMSSLARKPQSQHASRAAPTTAAYSAARPAPANVREPAPMAKAAATSQDGGDWESF